MAEINHGHLNAKTPAEDCKETRRRSCYEFNHPAKGELMRSNIHNPAHRRY